MIKLSYKMYCRRNRLKVFRNNEIVQADLGVLRKNYNS